MIIVSDTSPLSGLLAIGKAEILPSLFSEVVIPPAVQFELLRKHSKLPDWLVVCEPKEAKALAITITGLDAGEAQAITLALQLKTEAILMDERKGRKVAIEMGLRPIGLLGLTLLAKERSLISSAKGVVGELQEAGCYFAPSLIQRVLYSAGEE